MQQSILEHKLSVIIFVWDLRPETCERTIVMELNSNREKNENFTELHGNKSDIMLTYWCIPEFGDDND